MGIYMAERAGSGQVTTVVAREYLRVSLDRSGRARSNSEQQQDNRRSWDLFEFGDCYSDTTSASRYATKVRGGYRELIRDLTEDRFGANVLVLWEGSRGSRRVGEWVELIELCEDRGVKIAVTTDERLYDPANPRDRKSLLETATDAEYESAKISARIRRANAANAAAGRPHGHVPYGYQRFYDPVTRAFVAQEPVESEAVVVREVFERIKSGHSLNAIARDFAARKIRSRTGKPLSAVRLRQIALNPTYAGLRTFTPDGKKMTPTERRRNATLIEAVWPGIVPKRTYLAVQRILEDPARRASHRPGRAFYLLSMIARCDACGGPLAVTYRPTGSKAKRQRREQITAQYFCRDRGCLRVDMADLDDRATEAMLDYLSRPDNVQRLLTDDHNSDDLERTREQVAEIRAELDELADKVGRGELSSALAARAEPQIRERLRAAEAREAELSTPSALRGLIEPGEDVAERWHAAPISAKRRIARILLAPDVLGELRVTRTPKRGLPCPAIDRMVWATDDDR